MKLIRIKNVETNVVFFWDKKDVNPLSYYKKSKKYIVDEL